MSSAGTHRWIPQAPVMGPIEKSAVNYAFKAWVAYHAVQIIDPSWFDLPFSSVILFAVFGAAKGLDRPLRTDSDRKRGGDLDE